MRRRNTTGHARERAFVLTMFAGASPVGGDSGLLRASGGRGLPRSR